MRIRVSAFQKSQMFLPLFCSTRLICLCLSCPKSGLFLKKKKSYDFYFHLNVHPGETGDV